MKKTHPRRFNSAQGLGDYIRQDLRPIGVIVLSLTIIPVWFWPAVAAFYCGVAWLWLDVGRQLWWRALVTPRRTILLMIYFATVGLLSWAWIFTNAPVGVWSAASVGDFGSGTVLHGIEWDTPYSELTVRITNASSYDYDDFTADITTEQRIEAFVQTSGLAKCTSESDSPWPVPTVQHFEGGKAAGPAGQGGVTYAGQTSRYIVVPADINGHIMGRFAGFTVQL